MSGTGEGRRDGREGHLVPGVGYEDYRSARERYFERLRVDSEIRRLEKAWRLPVAIAIRRP